MDRLVQISGGTTSESVVTCLPKQPRARVFWLQGVTVGWRSIEFGVAIYAAAKAHSPALLAFGSDSIVELISAVVVLLQWIPGRSSPNARRLAQLPCCFLFSLPSCRQQPLHRWPSGCTLSRAVQELRLPSRRCSRCQYWPG